MALLRYITKTGRGTLRHRGQSKLWRTPEYTGAHASQIYCCYVLELGVAAGAGSSTGAAIKSGAAKKIAEIGHSAYPSLPATGAKTFNHMGNCEGM